MTEPNKEVESPTEDELRRRKLIREIADLEAAPARARQTARLAIITAMLTATTTVAVTAWGFFVGGQLQRNADRQHEVEAYSKLLQEVGDQSAAVRLGAVVALDRYASVDRSRSDDRSEQTVAVMLGRLSAEDDGSVLQMLIEKLSSVGASVLPQTVTAQQQATDLLRDATTSYQTSLFAQLCAADRDVGRTGGRVHDILATRFREGLLVLGTHQSNEPKRNEGVLVLGTHQNNDPKKKAELEYLDDAYWLRIHFERDFTEFACQPPKAGDAIVLKETQRYDARAVERLGRAVIAMGRVVGNAIKRDTAAARSLDFSDAVIADVEWDGLDFSSSHLSKTYISGYANSARFDQANFDGADLQRLHLGHASFKSATLHGTQFTAWLVQTESPVFSDADWWDAVMVGWPWFFVKSISPDSCEAPMPELRRLYGKPPHDGVHVQCGRTPRATPLPQGRSDPPGGAGGQ